jgi:hypothetical protein
MGHRRSALRGLVGKTERKRPLGNPRYGWQNINMGWKGVHWSYMAQDMDEWRALVTALIKLTK